MMSFSKRFITRPLWALLLVASLGWWWYTPSGLRFTARLAVMTIPHIRAIHVQRGLLAGTWDLASVKVALAGQVVPLKQVRVHWEGMRWRPHAGLSGVMHVHIHDVQWPQPCFRDLLPVHDVSLQIAWRHGRLHIEGQSADQQAFRVDVYGAHAQWQGYLKTQTTRGRLHLTMHKSQHHQVIRLQDSSWCGHPLQAQWLVQPSGQWRLHAQGWLQWHEGGWPVGDLGGAVYVQAHGDERDADWRFTSPSWSWAHEQGPFTLRWQQQSRRAQVRFHWQSDATTWQGHASQRYRKPWRGVMRVERARVKASMKAQLSRKDTWSLEVQQAELQHLPKHGAWVAWHLRSPTHWQYPMRHAMSACLTGHHGHVCVKRSKLGRWVVRLVRWPLWVFSGCLAEHIDDPKWSMDGLLDGQVSWPSGGQAKPGSWHIRAHHMAIRWPQVGLVTDPQDSTLSLDLKEHRLQVDGLWSLAGHLLKLRGQTDLESQRGHWRLSGERLPLKRPSHFNFQLSPNLTLNNKGHDVHVAGTLIVHSGHLTYTPTLSLLTLPPEVHVHQHTDQFEQAVIPWQWWGAWDLQLPKGIDVDLGGLTGRLRGQLRLEHHGPFSPLAKGRLELTRPALRHMAEAKVSFARASFFHAPWQDPSLQLLITRPVDMNRLDGGVMRTRVLVGLQIDGPLSEKRWQLFSIPAGLSREAILLGLLNADGSELKDNHVQLLTQLLFASDLTKNNNPLRRPMHRIERLLGVDDISFSVAQNTLPGHTGPDRSLNHDSSVLSPVLQIRKKLDDKLTLGYTSVLDQNDNEFSLAWSVSKGLSLKAHTDAQGSGVNLLWSSQ